MKKIWSALLGLLAIITVTLPAHALSSHSYTIAVDAVANGGGTMSSANYAISSLAGQSLVTGPVSSANHTVQGGFYYIHILEELLLKRATCLVFSASALYAGFDGEGIWKSTDSGGAWSAATTQPANQRIKGLAIHPTTRTMLYAASYGGGIYRSINSGVTWTACANTGLSGAGLNAVSLAITSVGRLYAGTEAGIFTSSDCATWSAANSGLTVDAATPPVSIAIDPATPTTLYTGLDGAGVFQSTDNGGTWNPANGTSPNNLANLRVKAVVINTTTPATLYAATYGGGIYKSVNSAASWSACTAMSNQNVLSLIIDANGKLYAGTEAGVFTSRDNCATWMSQNSGLP